MEKEHQQGTEYYISKHFNVQPLTFLKRAFNIPIWNKTNTNTEKHYISKHFNVENGGSDHDDVMMRKLVGPPNRYLHSFCIAMSAPGGH